jgi:hypothetical protein
MPLTHTTHVAGALLGATLLFVASTAHADVANPPKRSGSPDKKECAQAHGDAQKSMRDGLLRKAREELKTCARDECIPLVRKDCVAWLDEVNANLPSIVIEAKGPDGKETFDVRLTINNEPTASKLDVKAIDLDPGTWSMRFEREGSPPIDKEIVLRQAQKNKLVEVSFAAPPVATEPRGVPTRGETAEAPRRRSLLPWVLGGLGVALAGGGVFFWASSESTRSDLQSSCAPRCDPKQADDIKTQRLVGDILAVTGVLAVGAAAVWLLTDRAAPKAPNGGVHWTGMASPFTWSF